MTCKTFLVLMLLAGLPQSLHAAGPAAADSVKPLRIASPALSPAIYLGREMVKAIYERAGLDIQFIELPFARSIQAAEAGVVDGELARAPAIVDGTVLVPLALPLTHIRIVAVRHESQPQITGIEQLQGLLTGHLNGMRSLATRLQEHALATVPANNEQLLELLDLGRLDAALMMERDAAILIRHHPELEMGPILLAMPVYHYIHVDHRALVPLLSQAQEKLIMDGTMAELEDRTQRYLASIYTSHRRQDDAEEKTASNEADH